MRIIVRQPGMGGVVSQPSPPALHSLSPTKETTTTPPADGDDSSFASYESGDIADARRPAPPTATAAASPTSYPAASSPDIHANARKPPSRPSLSPDGRSSSSTASTHSRHHASPLDRPQSTRASLPEARARPPQPRIDTRPPRTPPSADKAAPVIVSTPPTPVDADAAPRVSPGHGSPDVNGPSPSMSAQRRSRSPSKLSSTTLAPLTPTVESGEETPSAPGFFSTVLSAAQSAASTLSSNMASTAIAMPGSKSRSSLNRPPGSSASDPELGPRPPEPPLDQAVDPKKDLAVRTLGSGDLSLSQLGIAEPAGPVASPASAKFSDAADAWTRFDSAPVESQAQPRTETPRSEPSSRPRSLVEATLGDQTPPPGEMDSKSPVQRASSIRSAMKPHRKRGSSTTMGSTRTAVGAAIAAANSSAMHPSAGFGAPKLTGFAIASKRRNRDFHSLFKSVPDDDYLIEDYSCALQREILAHGRLYVSEGHLCFSSNILGWTTTLVMSFDEIVSVEKRSTALVFKNGLMISTLHAKHIFASFTSRDATYDLIVNIWKLGHPTLKSTLNGVRLEGTGGDKTEKVEAAPSIPGSEAPAGSESDDDDDDDDDFYDEEENEHVPDTQATEVSGVDAEPDKSPPRKASTMTAPAGDVPREAPAAASVAADFPGPAAHAPTDCGDSASHYERVVGDDTIAAPLGKVYNLVFGPGSVEWMARWLTGDQKCNDMQMEDKKGLTTDNRTRHYTYIKPLNASIGPRQTKCIVAETLENLDLERAVNLSVSTQNPDVPSGNVFSVKTKYCLSWAENNATRLQVNCTVEWTGKSWLKGPIEKGVGDGQTQYCKDLFAALKASVSSRPRACAAGGGAARGKKKAKRSRAAPSSEEGGGGAARKAGRSWGLLETARRLAEPCVDVVRPLTTGNVMYGLLVGLLVAMWFGFRSAPSKSARAVYGPGAGPYGPYRAAAYDEMWRREESELWEWLEERVGLDRLGSAGAARPGARAMEERLGEGWADAREADEALRVTEEKLRVLRGAMARARRGADEGDGGRGREGR